MMTDSTDNARGPDLLPCPFCGGDDQYLTEDARDHGFIGCHECHARGPIADQVGDWTRPYTAWNRRADLAPDPLADPHVVATVEAAAKLGRIIGFLGEDEARIAAFREACGPNLLRRALAAFDKGGKTNG